MTDKLKTPGAWCAELGYEVLDPDGWRGSEGRPWTDPITRAEFEERLVTCTQRKVPPKKADDRAEMQERRKHGLEARHETRVERAQTVIGELEQQVRVQPELAFVRVVVANEEGEHVAALRLTPDAAERLANILLQTKAVVETP